MRRRTRFGDLRRQVTQGKITVFGKCMRESAAGPRGPFLDAACGKTGILAEFELSVKSKSAQPTGTHDAHHATTPKHTLA